MEPANRVAGVTTVDMTGEGSASVSADALYDRCYTRLVRILAATAGSVVEAEDIVQESFVRLICHRKEVSDHEDPQAWVRMVAFRLNARPTP
jgi:RNA polymerase sigma-70 factor (ECF subfamily)